MNCVCETEATLRHEPVVLVADRFVTFRLHIFAAVSVPLPSPGRGCGAMVVGGAAFSSARLEVCTRGHRFGSHSPSLRIHRRHCLSRNIEVGYKTGVSFSPWCDMESAGSGSGNAYERYRRKVQQSSPEGLLSHAPSWRSFESTVMRRRKCIAARGSPCRR